MKLVISLTSLVFCAQFLLQVAAQSEEDGNEIVRLLPRFLEPVPMLLPIIVGGNYAAHGEFPHQISLRLRGSHICGGSIISRNFILTAAHCVTTRSNQNINVTPSTLLSVRAGSVSSTTGGVSRNVARVVVHPGYESFDNDIALLRLTSPLDFNQRVKAIELETSTVPAGSRIFISGWGRLSSRSSIRPTRLKYTTATAITIDECRQRIGAVDDSLLCLSHRVGTGACQGDSGGPAVYNGRLVGVTNFIINNCGGRFPDGFANVTYHLNWVRENSDLVHTN